jgi:hypothetical protein
MAQTRFRFPPFSGAFLLKIILLTGLILVLQAPSVLLAQGIPRRWQNRQYKPPTGIGAPRRTEGGGTRSPEMSCPVVGKPLTALVPGNRFGVTVSAYPEFVVYMPGSSAESPPLPVEFLLVDKDKNTVYKSVFKTTGNPGILTLRLPQNAGLAPLKIGEDYQWSFSIICQADERSQDITVDGWVRRIELDAALKNQLQQASPEQQVELYANAEIWQDALATLIELRRDRPNDVTIAATWQQLLNAADLSNLAQETLLPSSATPENPSTSFQGHTNRSIQRFGGVEP